MKQSRGFTLIELAIVMVIVTILIGGLAMPLSAQIQARRIAETNKTLDEAREAIVGYAMSHTSTTIPARNYLPCPDKLDDDDPATTNDGDGIEESRVGGVCPQSAGYLPWITLGTGIQDAWGNRLRYAVTDAFSNSAGFSNTSTGDLQICNSSANTGTSDCGALGNVAANVPVVLVSHGPNGWGARNINGTTLSDPSSNHEKENANTNNVDKEFVSRPPSNDAASEFDDLVKWISADQLRGRICPAGGCQ